VKFLVKSYNSLDDIPNKSREGVKEWNRPVLESGEIKN